MATVDTIKKYTEELKALDISNSGDMYRLPEYMGISRVLYDIYKDNAEVNSAIREYNDALNKICSAQSNQLLNQMNKEVEMLSKLVKKTENKEAFDKDKLASVKGSVTQLFQDQLLPYIAELEKNKVMSDDEKIYKAQEKAKTVLTESTCSTEYFQRKMNYIQNAKSLNDIRGMVIRVIQNGRKYTNKKED